MEQIKTISCIKNLKTQAKFEESVWGWISIDSMKNELLKQKYWLEVASVN